LFHISENQPFIDGNKRTATAAAILFLWLNDHVVIGGNEALLELVFKVASRQATKADIAAFLQRQAQPMVRPRA
jgi:death on curing protein